MHDTKFIDASISVDDLFEDRNCFPFWDGSAGFDHFAEVSALAEFGDDAGVGFEREDLV